MRRLGQVLLIILISFSHVISGEKDRSDIPDEQRPVEERERGDSVPETLGKVPGALVSFPLKLLFTGARKTARVLDDNGVVLRVTDWLTSADGKRKVRPIFTPLSGGGLAFKQNDLLKPGLRLRASASIGVRTRRDFFIGLRDEALFHPRLGFEASAFHTRKPDEDFFGIGNNSSEANETNYLHRENNVRLGVVSRIGRRSLFSMLATYSDVRIGEGRDRDKPSLDSLFTSQTVPGFFGADVFSTGASFYRDTKDTNGHPTRGGEEFIAFEVGYERGGSEFGYHKATADFSRYFNLFYKRVLALRVRAEVTNSIGDRRIPFFRMSELGGQELLRGYRPVRFRDRDMALAGAEYRWQVQHFAIAYLFVEEGRVFSDLIDEFSLKGFRYSYGGGLRLIGKDRNLITIIEWAKSREQLRFIFRLNVGVKKL